VFSQAFLLEDEPSLAKAIQIALKRMDISVTHVFNLNEALRFMSSTSFTDWPSLMLVDRTLPDGDGLEFVKLLRDRNYGGAICVLSAKSQPVEKVEGLNKGADDYLAKPFDFEELEARIRVLGRRVKETATIWKADPHSRKILGPNGWVTLTPIEYKFCEALLNQPGILISRDDLLKNVWGYQFLPKTRTVDFFWGKLRKSFELDPENPVHFLTVRGLGYRFNP